MNGQSPQLMKSNFQGAFTQVPHEARVRMELKNVGLSNFAMNRSEVLYLPKIIHANEDIGGAVYGRHKNGYVILVATDRRVLFVDRKPLFINIEEITYDVVSGINFSNAWLATTVTLHTRLKEYTVRTYNTKSALCFVEYIELRCLEHIRETAL